MHGVLRDDQIGTRYGVRFPKELTWEECQGSHEPGLAMSQLEYEGKGVGRTFNVPNIA